ncbi:MAG: SHOCT domain-containing protein [Actinomycetota bacterium]|nr:SHOCT domain-containing protein [Actinomycetota bacterium]
MDWSLWDVIWTTFVVFVWVMFIVILINVLIDLFRSHDLSGWAKALWVIVLVVLPFLGVLIYLIARGGGMQERAIKQHQQDVAQLKQMVGGAGTPADEIAQAKALLDSGAIDQAEYEKLKAKALG